MEQIEHLLVEHLPWPDLLLDHVVAGALDVLLLFHSDRKTGVLRSVKDVAIIPQFD
jgi:hypothetical protein